MSDEKTVVMALLMIICIVLLFLFVGTWYKDYKSETFVVTPPQRVQLSGEITVNIHSDGSVNKEDMGKVGEIIKAGVLGTGPQE